MAHCPPALLATGSYDGEIIVWNVVSGCIVCRFISPPPEEEQLTGGGDLLKLTGTNSKQIPSVLRVERWNAISIAGFTAAQEHSFA